MPHLEYIVILSILYIHLLNFVVLQCREKLFAPPDRFLLFFAFFTLFTLKCIKSSNKLFFCLYMALLTGKNEIWQETGWERRGVTRSKGHQARTWTRGFCSKDKASIHVHALVLGSLLMTRSHAFCTAGIVYNGDHCDCPEAPNPLSQGETHSTRWAKEEMVRLLSEVKRRRKSR